MTKKISICGLDCSICPAFIAFSTDDRTLREKTASEWSKAYHFDFTPEMVDCVGCTTIEGVHIGHCFECQIRKCGLGKNVENCARCADYPCSLIADFIAKVPPAKANLEEIRAGYST